LTSIPAAILLDTAAPGGATPSPSPIGFLLPMAAIFVIFYFLLIRPQTKRQKEHDAMLKTLERGDRVVTAGGLHGVVVGLTDDVLTVEIGSAGSQRMRVKVDRSRIERVEKGKGGESE
jgi:preprotein translocase subunit YajC